MADTAAKPCCCRPPWVTGHVATKTGEIPVISATLSGRDRPGRIWCRLSNRFRMSHTVAPGLYAEGEPHADSPVLVTANYRLSFDMLRRKLIDRSAWLLVLDTKGINVWCAAGKGTFSTAELIARIEAASLEDVVAHRRLILPQLAAPGVRAHEIRRATAFRVVYGPVYAHDLDRYLANDCRATPDMRRVRFGLFDRLILTPMELSPALVRYYVPFALGALAFFGLDTTGILFRKAAVDGFPFLFLGLLAMVLGAFVGPLLLPFIPTRSFAFKGWLLGLLGIAATDVLLPHLLSGVPFARMAAYLVFPMASSFLMLTFTGATPVTSPSGVKRELRPALWSYALCSATAGILLVIHKLTSMGIV